MPKQDLSSRHFQRKISEFCEVRIVPIAPKRVVENVLSYLISLIIYRKPPPILNGLCDRRPVDAADGSFAQSASAPRGPAPKPISPFPEPLFEATEYPASFQDALVYHMRRFGDSYWQLYRAVIRLGETFDDKTLLDRVPGGGVASAFAVPSGQSRDWISLPRRAG